MVELPRIANFIEQKQFRIIPSCYPPINFFEALVDPSEMEVLWEIEALTNERLRQEAGDIHVVPIEDRICGPGSSVVMAAFTHITLYNPTRFSNGSFGVYYAGFSPETAIRETVYHRERFLRATQEKPCELTMRLYEGSIKKPLHDIRHKKFLALHDPDNYLKSQVFGHRLKTLKSWGIIYNSVRHKGATCIAALRPPTISIPKPLTHLKYIWNGKRISEVLDIKSLMMI